MKEIYIHIGNFKTGTTSIQKVCHDKSKRLDFYYPRSCRPKNNLTNHGLLSLSLLSEYNVHLPAWFIDRDVSFDDVVITLKEEIRDKPKILISTEEFFHICSTEYSVSILKRLKSAFDDFKIKIVMYVREPFGFLKSWYNQGNKNIGGIGTNNFLKFLYFMDEALLSQNPVYDVFSSVFGENNVTVKPFCLRGVDHINDFFSSIQSGYSLGEGESKYINKSLDESRLELNRIGKQLNNIHNALVSNGVDLSILERKIDRINSEFSKLQQRIGYKLESELSLKNVMLDYIKRALTIKELLDVEVPFLRDNAIKYEKKDMELSYIMMKAAIEIRPYGDFIREKLLSYEKSLGIDRCH